LLGLGDDELYFGRHAAHELVFRIVDLKQHVVKVCLPCSPVPSAGTGLTWRSLPGPGAAGIAGRLEIGRHAALQARHIRFRHARLHRHL
jgi:hypothetical protein